MAIVLGLTTASPRGGVAIWRDGDIVAAEHYEDEKRHAERIFTVVRSVVSAAGLERSAIDAIGCDVGPGSFTGVRVGLASAKGMALALGRPLYPVGALEAMAAAAFAEAPAVIERMVALLDAKRGEVFVGAYGRDGRPLREASHAPAGEVLASLKELVHDQGLRFCGRAAEVLGVPSDRRIDAAAAQLPDASWIARLAADQLAAGAAPDLADVEPVYLRAPDAKRPKQVVSPFV
jgi:tRNA threonylcarbamoyladenosine biosynthesis protein TsaB